MSDAPGTIRSADGFVYVLTPEDLLWLARAAQYEGGTSPESTLWTYASRLVDHRGTSMKALVRSHSQPLNPDWASLDSPGCRRSPERCRPRLRADGTYTRDPLEVRAEARNAPWESLETRELALDWAAGRVPNPSPRSTDFADEEVSRSFLERHPDARVVRRAGNWYIAEGSSVDWPRDFVTINGTGDAGFPWLGPLVGFGVAIAAGAAVFGIASAR